MSFKKSLCLIVDAITKQSIPDDDGEVEARPAVAPITPPRSSRSQAATQRIDLPLLRTSKTPSRNVQAKFSKMEEKLASGKLDTSSKIVLERAKECTGFPIYCVGADGKLITAGSRGTCVHCKTLTHWYCIGCKRWACMSQSDEVEKVADWKPSILITADKTGDHKIFCNNSCFQTVHGKAQHLFLSKRDEGFRKEL